MGKLNNGSITVNPLQQTPGLGAAWALQGVAGALPLFHAAPGCTFLGKVLLTQHSREPVALDGSDMKEMSAILGSQELLEKRVKAAVDKFSPSMVVILSTALAEVRGEDSVGFVRDYQAECAVPLLYLSAADYDGNFAVGYARLIGTLLDRFVPDFDAATEEIASDQINLLCGSHLTPGDVDEIRNMVESCGLKPILIPDLARGIDGSRQSFSNVALDGLTLEELALSARSVATFSIGSAMEPVAKRLVDRLGHQTHSHFAGLSGVGEIDRFFALLMQLGGSVPTAIRRQRARIVDALIDTHLFTQRQSLAVALSGEHLAAIRPLLSEMGLDIAVEIRDNEGDLEDLEDAVVALGGQPSRRPVALIGNSHAAASAERLHLTHLRYGFPIFDRFGETNRVRVGYRGSMESLFELANAAMERAEH